MAHRLKYKNRTINLEDHIEENIGDIEFGNYFLDITPKIWSVREKLSKFNFIKIKNFCSAEAYKWIKKQNAD